MVSLLPVRVYISTFGSTIFLPLLVCTRFVHKRHSDMGSKLPSFHRLSGMSHSLDRMLMRVRTSCVVFVGALMSQKASYKSNKRTSGLWSNHFALRKQISSTLLSMSGWEDACNCLRKRLRIFLLFANSSIIITEMLY